MYCFDTDVLSTLIRRDPPMSLVRRMARVPVEEQVTTAITVGEMLFGVARRRSAKLATSVRRALSGAVAILPFDERSAEVYGPLRATLEAAGQRLAEPDLRIASIVLAHDLTLVTGNVRHFERVPSLRVENWLDAGRPRAKIPHAAGVRVTSYPSLSRLATSRRR